MGWAIVILVIYGFIKRRRDRKESAQRAAPFVQAGLRSLQELCDARRARLIEMGYADEAARKATDCLLGRYSDWASETPPLNADAVGDFVAGVQNIVDAAVPDESEEFDFRAVTLQHLDPTEQSDCAMCGTSLNAQDEPFYLVVRGNPKSTRRDTYCQPCATELGLPNQRQNT